MLDPVCDVTPAPPPYGCPDAIRRYVEEIQQSGITVIPGSIPPDVCDRIRIGFDEFAARNAAIFDPNRDDHGHFPRIVNLHLAYAALFELFALNDSALAVQDFLFGAETVLYTSLYYERGSAQTIHRDTPYFSTKPEYRYFGMWVALEDTDKANGPLTIVRYGHLIPEIDREAMALRFFPNLSAIDPGSGPLFQAYQDELNSECRKRGLNVEEVHVKKGDTIIWHPQAPHGGAEIRDLKRTRHSIVMHTTPVGVPVYHQDVFFNPTKPASTEAPWAYIEKIGRQYADFQEVSFGHLNSRTPTEFKT